MFSTWKIRLAPAPPVCTSPQSWDDGVTAISGAETAAPGTITSPQAAQSVVESSVPSRVTVPGSANARSEIATDAALPPDPPRTSARSSQPAPGSCW
jgi:hypothetical protein